MISPFPVAKIIELDHDPFTAKHKETVEKIFSATALICTNMVAHTLYNISLLL